MYALVGDGDVPVYAVGGVDDVIRRDDAEKERILRPMFGEEWATTRSFPTDRVADGDRVTLGGVTFRVVDVGPGESPHDSWWMLESAGRTSVFAGEGDLEFLMRLSVEPTRKRLATGPGAGLTY